jgi:hypothetical protein
MAERGATARPNCVLLSNYNLQHYGTVVNVVADRWERGILNSMLTKDDGDIITRAIVTALAKWSGICALVAIAIWMIRVAMHDMGAE